MVARDTPHGWSRFFL